MSGGAVSPRAAAWAPLVAFAVVCNGLAAGVWKHAGMDVRRFCVLFVLGKAVAGAGLWLARGRRSFCDRASRPFLGFAFLTSVLNGLGWIAYFVAFERGPLALVQSVTAAYTAVAAVLAVLFLRERISRAQVVGVTLVIAAGVLLAYAEEATSGGAGGGHRGWLAASFVAVGLWGANAALAKHAFQKPRADDPRFFVVLALGMAVTILPYGLSVAPAAPGGAAGSAAFGSGAALAVALLYVAGDLGVFAAIARGPGSIVNPLAGLYPLPAIAYGVLVLGDVPDRLGWIAIAMVLPGMVLAVPGTLAPVARCMARRGLRSQQG